jgi:beta-lactamase regulating signal transducer with metallopeptidase domain
VLLPVRGMGFAGVSAAPHTATIIEASHQEVLAPPAKNNLPQRRNRWAAFGPLFAERTGNLRLTSKTAHWLLRFYVATIVIGLFRIARAWLATRTLVQNSQETCLADRDRAVLEDYSRRLGIKPPQLRESAEVSSPMIVGARTPVLLLPEGFARHAENEIRAALCHELAHVQRQDYLLNVACQLAAVPLAWHPAVDWVQQRIHMTREMVCDAMAAQEMKSHLGYAKCLLALAHSMLGKRNIAAEPHFMGLFGNHTLEERVMRLMDTTTMSVRAKAARVASGAAMMIATGVIAGMFHVAPTMAQANVPPQATQNPPADAQPAVPEPKTSAPSVATPATPKKHTYVRRNRDDGESRESTLVEQPLVDKDVQQRMNDLQSQLAEDMAKANNPEFKKRMDDAQRQMADAAAKFNSPEFKQRMDDLQSQLAENMAKTNTADLQKRMEDAQRQMADAATKFNSEEFRQGMDDLRRQMTEDMAKSNTADLQKRIADAQQQVADAAAKFNSQDFRQRMDDLRRQLAEDMAKTNTPDLQKRMEDAQRQMADAAMKFNSPEFKQRMDDFQKQVEQQMEEFRRRSAHSPNP